MPKSGIRLFRLFGIQVYLHWSWIVVALYELQTRKNTYSSNAWNVAEYLSLFVIVLMHEFGHALACRSVGGQADRILLWPLGGVAYVSPPQRPGAILWSIAAGPLVNVLLLPVTIGLYTAARHGGWATPDARHYLQAVAFINFLLLVFNLMPAYPLDGGQILRALLWFLIGPITSLRVACVIGLCGAGAVLVWAVRAQSIWLGVMGAFMGLQSWAGLMRARGMARGPGTPRTGFVCPSCGAPPPVGPFWKCPCGQSFDTFDHDGMCPRCGRVSEQAGCPRCRRSSPQAIWATPEPRGFPLDPAPPAPPFVPAYGGGGLAFPPPPPPPAVYPTPPRE